MYRKKVNKVVDCIECYASFTQTRRDQKYCSTACRTRAYQKRREAREGIGAVSVYQKKTDELEKIKKKINKIEKFINKNQKINTNRMIESSVGAGISLLGNHFLTKKSKKQLQNDISIIKYTNQLILAGYTNVGTNVKKYKEGIYLEFYQFFKDKNGKRVIR